MCPHKTHIKTLLPNMLVLRGGELGKQLGLNEVKKEDALLCCVRVQ